MLSYRHLYHAGNLADVFKHAVQVCIIDFLKRKDKPFVYIDTHASAALFDLNSAFAKKTAEHTAGISKIYKSSSVPDVLKLYLDCVSHFNSGKKCRFYPGSAAFAQLLLRPEDRGHCFELHPTDFKLLKKNITSKRFKVEQRDGLQALNAILPPLERRALVVIDPSYEIKSDYETVLDALNLSIKKFMTGIYMIWYPLLDNPKNKAFRRMLKNLPVENSLQSELVFSKVKAEHRLKGSGLFIINPPYILKDQIKLITKFLLTT